MSKTFADELFDTIRRIAPDLPDATVWKLIAAIVSVIAREKGIDLT
jgi:hypothetical protein